jgi:FtsP/CotA-like multicopper oxidase with cupredoxin domain
MRAINTNTLVGRFLRAAPLALAGLLAGAAHAAAPGITGAATTPAFSLSAAAAYISQPDGTSLYAWGYGCQAAPTGFLPTAIGTAQGANCPQMQLPGPTLIVHKGDTVSVTLTNNLPKAAGNTSILFPGFDVTTSCGTTGTPGPLTCEAANGGQVTYTFTANSEGTHSYYSGTQGDLQIEMGLYGAIVVLPATVPGNCTGGLAAANLAAETFWGESDYRLAPAAYSHSATCYDREYLFQFSEMDPRIHQQVEAQVLADNSLAVASQCAKATGCLVIDTEPYHPTYYMINGRSMPDDMDPNYSAQYPHQPYNGNPHMHPGELTLLRIIGQGRMQHPFHEHGNHVRVLARDGNLLLAPNLVTVGTVTETEYRLAGPLMFTTTTTPGQAMDGIFQWTGKGLNWDVYSHTATSSDPSAKLPCTPDANGFNTGAGASTAINFWEWCADHNKPLEKAPFGDVGGGGPMTLPDPNIVTNGPWYSGSPYLGPDAAVRSVGASPIPPSGTVANSATGEAGFAYMWHSHNEREITTGNIFPGGMLMMMLVDSREFVIDESK